MKRRMERRALRLCAALACAAVILLPPAPALAEGEKSYVMKLSTATINDSQHEWLKLFSAAVEKDSGGRIKGEIYPASQLGSIPRQIEGTQFGSIQGWSGPPEFLVGVDERFEVLSAPGLFASAEQANRVIADLAVKDMILGFGADKGLIGVSLTAIAPSAIVMRRPVHHLAEFKGKKIRVLASPFQTELVTRMGATPVAMTLADVLPALQGGTIDGAILVVPVLTTMQYYDAAKYAVETGQPFVFSVVELSKRWFDALPPDLQTIIRDEAAKAAQAIGPWETDFYAQQRKLWTDNGGELISLPEAEQAAMMESVATIGDDLSKTKPALNQAFRTLRTAVEHNK